MLMKPEMSGISRRAFGLRVWHHLLRHSQIRCPPISSDSVMRIRFPKENLYSDKYQDESYEYRHVIMNEATARKVWMLTDFMSRLMPEKEWRAAGVDQQTRGWIHYDAWNC